MSDFATSAELTLTTSQSAIRSVRQEIEAGLSDVQIGLSAGGGGGGQPRDPESGQFMAIEGVEQRLVDQTSLIEEQLELDSERNALLSADGQGGGRGQRRERQEFRWARERTEYLEELVDLVDDMDGDGGGSLIDLGGAGAGIGTGAAAAGLGVAGLGIGAGMGILDISGAVGDAIRDTDFSLPDPELNITGPFIETPDNVEFKLGPGDLEFSPTIGENELSFNPTIGEKALNFAPTIGENELSFNPTIGEKALNFAPTIGEDAINFQPQFGPDKFDVTLGPDKFNISPEIGDINNNLSLSNSIDVSADISISAVDLSGLSDDVASQIVNDNLLLSKLQSEVDSAVDDLESQLRRGLR